MRIYQLCINKANLKFSGKSKIFVSNKMSSFINVFFIFEETILINYYEKTLTLFFSANCTI